MAEITRPAPIAPDVAAAVPRIICASARFGWLGPGYSYRDTMTLSRSEARYAERLGPRLTRPATLTPKEVRNA